ncbi:hypothetical protein BC827DRAFT_488783 [Russula dissimulans]|nr:hypothetical protein BC827DRAFT_488783 [Russula dissimulans]
MSADDAFPRSVPSSDPTWQETTVVPAIVSSDFPLSTIPMLPHHSNVTLAEPRTSGESQLIQPDHISQAPSTLPSSSPTIVRSHIPAPVTFVLDMDATARVGTFSCPGDTRDLGAPIEVENFRQPSGSAWLATGTVPSTSPTESPDDGLNDL